VQQRRQSLTKAKSLAIRPSLSPKRKVKRRRQSYTSRNPAAKREELLIYEGPVMPSGQGFVFNKGPQKRWNSDPVFDEGRFCLYDRPHASLFPPKADQIHALEGVLIHFVNINSPRRYFRWAINIASFVLENWRISRLKRYRERFCGKATSTNLSNTLECTVLPSSCAHMRT
jgi:hypothetical protein